MKVLLQLFRALSFIIVFIAVGNFLADLAESWSPALTEEFIRYRGPDDWEGYTTTWGRHIGHLLTLVFVVGGVGYAHAYLVRRGATCCSQCGISLIPISVAGGYCENCWKTLIRRGRRDTQEHEGDHTGSEQAITEEMIDKHLGKEKKYVGGIRIDDPADD